MNLLLRIPILNFQQGLPTLQHIIYSIAQQRLEKNIKTSVNLYIQFRQHSLGILAIENSRNPAVERNLAQIHLYFENIFTFDPLEPSNGIYHCLQISS